MNELSRWGFRVGDRVMVIPWDEPGHIEEFYHGGFVRVKFESDGISIACVEERLTRIEEEEE